MIEHGRQMATRLEDIRTDHVERYRAAVAVGRRFRVSSISDLGAGCGYGSALLADAFPGVQVTGYDKDPSVVSFAETHFRRSNVKRETLDFSLLLPPFADMAVAFEVLEHFPCETFLSLLQCRVLVGSVPNELVIPHGPQSHPEHVRHYTPQQLLDLLAATGWRLQALGTQLTKTGPGAAVRWCGRVRDREYVGGRTLVFAARRQ